MSSITVIDQGPELFWFVSGALSQETIPLKHIQNISTGEKQILRELPEIVIINGDDKTLSPEAFINKMRNHVFARNTLFIVFTSDTSLEFKKSLLIAGAGQILYKGRGFGPSPKFFSSLVKWFLTHKEPDPLLFEYKPCPFPSEAEFTSFGRIGWLSPTQCMIETNINLSEGQSIEFNNSLFEELGISELKLECIEKNKVGRYYQYANSILCKIKSKDQKKDMKKLANWIHENDQLSKHKPIKMVYFESEPDYRDEIRQMIKSDKRYCARGYKSIDDFLEVLNYQLPQLILINRAIIQKDKEKFEAIKAFLKNHFCYCVTYSNSEIFSAEEFKKNYDFAMHAPSPISLELLESMVAKLEEKLPPELKNDEKKVYFNKYDHRSRLSLHSTCQLTELGINGATLLLPFELNHFCPCEISCHTFGIAEMNRSQFFRSFTNKKTTKGSSHRLIFIGQNVKDNEKVKSIIENVNRFGFERWLSGDTSDS